MPTTINGTTGVNLITDGSIVTADFASGAINGTVLPTGSVLQVVYASTTTSFSTTSTTLQDTGFSASITPSSSSSKILVISNSSMYVNQNGQGQTYVYGRASLARGSTQLQEQRLASNTGTTAILDIAGSLGITCLDSPATTSSVTYKIFISALNASFLTVFGSQGTSSLTLIEVKA